MKLLMKRAMVKFDFTEKPGKRSTMRFLATAQLGGADTRNMDYLAVGHFSSDHPCVLALSPLPLLALLPMGISHPRTSSRFEARWRQWAHSRLGLPSRPATARLLDWRQPHRIITPVSTGSMPARCQNALCIHHEDPAPAGLDREAERRTGIGRFF